MLSSLSYPHSISRLHKILLNFFWFCCYSLDTLDLRGTEWSCDCSVAEVKKWMDTTEVQVVGYDKFTCSDPQNKRGSLVKDLNIDELNCSQTLMEKTIILIIIGCTSFVILVVAAIIFWQHRWRLKKKLKKQHYRYCTTAFSKLVICNLIW